MPHPMHGLFSEFCEIRTDSISPSMLKPKDLNQDECSSYNYWPSPPQAYQEYSTQSPTMMSSSPKTELIPYMVTPSPTSPSDFLFESVSSQAVTAASMALEITFRPEPRSSRKRKEQNHNYYGYLPVQRRQPNKTKWEPVVPRRADSQFKCTWRACEMAFNRPEHLKRHEKSHTKEKPFGCNICNKWFSRSDNLKTHRNTHYRVGANNYIPGLVRC